MRLLVRSGVCSTGEKHRRNAHPQIVREICRDFLTCGPVFAVLLLERLEVSPTSRQLFGLDEKASCFPRPMVGRSARLVSGLSPWLPGADASSPTPSSAFVLLLHDSRSVIIGALWLSLCGNSTHSARIDTLPLGHPRCTSTPPNCSTWRARSCRRAARGRVQ